MDSESEGTLEPNHKLPTHVVSSSSFARVFLRMAQHITRWPKIGILNKITAPW